MQEETQFASQLRQLLEIDEVLGRLRWKAGKRSGHLAGTFRGSNKILIRIAGRQYSQNVLIWLMSTNCRPQAYTQREASSNNVSGLLGVSPKNGRFRASIRIHGRTRTIGDFATATEASDAYLSAKQDAGFLAGKPVKSAHDRSLPH